MPTVLAAAALSLAACGGGGRAMPTTPALDPQPVIRTARTDAGPPVRIRLPEAAEVRAADQSGDGGAAGRGHYALPGIGLIPPGDLKLSTDEIRDAVLIADVDPIFDFRRPPHVDLMRLVACGAYATACEDPLDPDRAPFRHYHPDTDDGWHARRLKFERAEELGAKIVSHSVGPFIALLDAHSGMLPLPFALVQPTGNDGLDSVFALSGYEPGTRRTFRYDPFRDMLVIDVSGQPLDDVTRTGRCWSLCPPVVGASFVNISYDLLRDFRNIRWAVTNDQVIYTAGYTIDSNGREVRHPGSNDCVGVEEACVWVPYQIFVSELGPNSIHNGTSYGPPRVAMAMASMLSVYPDLSPTNLVFLTRACARPVRTLSGNGIADFSCMLDIGEGGVVSVKDTEDLGLPDIIPPFFLPGSLTVATRLVDRQGRESPFRKLVPAAPMAHRSGLALADPDTPETFRERLPTQFRLAIRENVDLFGIQGPERRPGLGIAWRRNSLFAAVGHAVRDRFFGFAGGGGAWNFRGTREIGVTLGHDNLHLRFTNQRTRSRAELEGNSLGITARKEFGLRGGWRLGVLAEADRFLGGTARIPGMDGSAKIAAGRPGYRGEIRLTRPF